jgi:hypothetical protein
VSTIKLTDGVTMDEMNKLGAIMAAPYIDWLVY